MIDSSAAAPPLLLQLVLQQQTKLTGIDVVVATKEALKMKKKKLEQNEAQASTLVPWVQAYHRESSVPSFYETSLGSRNIASILACASFCKSLCLLP